MPDEDFTDLDEQPLTCDGDCQVCEEKLPGCRMIQSMLFERENDEL